MAVLTRLRDGRGDQGARSEAILFEEGKKPQVISNRPTVGACMLVGSVSARSYSHQDYWLTTAVTEILEENEKYVKFKTGNSTYEWFA